MPDNNGWSEYQRLVLNELTRHSEELESINKNLIRIELKFSNEITALKVKSGVWGLIGGLIPVAIGLIFIFLKEK